MDGWYFKVDVGGGDIEIGPVSDEVLRQQAAAGLIVADSEVRQADRRAWCAASDVDGLFPGVDDSAFDVPLKIASRSDRKRRRKRYTPKWYYAAGNEHVGPITAAALKRLVRDGTIGEYDLVWKPSLQTWTAAGRIKGLVRSKRSSNRSSSRTSTSVDDDRWLAKLDDLPEQGDTVVLPPKVTRSLVGRQSVVPATDGAAGEVRPSHPINELGQIDYREHSEHSQSEGQQGERRRRMGQPVFPASFADRIVAFTLDSFIVSGLVGLMMKVFVLLFGTDMFSPDSSSLPRSLVRVLEFLPYGLPAAIAILIGVAYYSFGESSWEQGTLGKRAIGLQTIDSDGGRLSFLHAFIRFVVRTAILLAVSIAVVRFGVTRLVSTPSQMTSWWTVFLVSIVFPLVPLAILAMTVPLMKDRQALHDLLTTTRVVSRG